MVWGAYFATVRALRAPTKDLESSFVFSVLLTLVSALAQPGFVLLCFLYWHRKTESYPVVPLKAQLFGALAAALTIFMLVAALALALASLASRFYQGAMTEALQICYTASFALLSTIILPIPGSTLFFLFRGTLPRFLISPMAVLVAFALGFYGMTDLATRSNLPALAFNAAACQLNTIMCLADG